MKIFYAVASRPDGGKIAVAGRGTAEIVSKTQALNRSHRYDFDWDIRPDYEWDERLDVLKAFDGPNAIAAQSILWN